jgi:hypothetical protein
VCTGVGPDHALATITRMLARMLVESALRSDDAAWGTGPLSPARIVKPLEYGFNLPHARRCKGDGQDNVSKFQNSF